MQAEIEIHKNWLRDECSLMERLHTVVAGKSPHGPFEKKDGYKWQLDSSNDWWAEIRDGKLVLASRYGGDRFKTLVEFCKVWLD